jgi:hypothetical protein
MIKLALELAKNLNAKLSKEQKLLAATVIIKKFLDKADN